MPKRRIEGNNLSQQPSPERLGSTALPPQTTAASSSSSFLHTHPAAAPAEPTFSSPILPAGSSGNAPANVSGPTSIIEIDFQRLDHNLNVIRRLIGPRTAMCCVIKADAYGLGAARIARRMQSWGVDMLAVYTLDHVDELVRHNVNTRILVLMPVRDMPRTGPIYRAVVSGRLHFVAHDQAHLQDLMRLADGSGCRLPVHVEVDTGMSRGGINPEWVEDMLRTIANTRSLALAGFFTHFSSSDSSEASTRAQLQIFTHLVESLGPALIPDTCFLHAANTHAMLRDPAFHLDMVRIGLAWTGLGPEALTDQIHLAESQRLRPIVSWFSSIVHLKWIEPRATVGYGRTFSARRPTRLALVPVGYADGYPIALSNKAVMRLRVRQEFAGQFVRHKNNGSRGSGCSSDGTPANQTDHWFEAPVVGRVSMDQTMIDVTDIPEGLVSIGSEVEVFSSDPKAPNSIANLAELARTIPYTLFCGLSSRLNRVYRNASDQQPVTGSIPATRPPRRLLKPNHPAA